MQDFRGKLSRDGKISGPDISFSLEKRLGGTRKSRPRARGFGLRGGYKTLHDGIKTEVMNVSIVAGDVIAADDPAKELFGCSIRIFGTLLRFGY